MNIQQHADALIARHTTGGLYLTPDEVLACAIVATQEYCAWADLDDTGWDGTSEGVVSTTSLTVDEWGIIGPLFKLLIDLGNATRQESVAGLGIPAPARSVNEVESSIEAYREKLSTLAFEALPVSAGFPDGF